MNNEVKERMLIKNKYLSKYACLDYDAVRLNPAAEDFRTDFFRDIDRIIFSLSYTRYIDKTQVFTSPKNDHISKRMTHVQMVSKIARTIGRALGLNEDLIEAASLGHDLGHVPFGHPGEKVLNDISLKHGEGFFNHNVQSVRLLSFVEHDGRGSNLCLQTLDAILCHNGEIECQKYQPVHKTKEDFIREYNLCYTDPKMNTSLVPMTLEGCVVRISDIISYIGKDVEDAITLKVIKKEDIPLKVRTVLGDTNTKIINTLVTDIINHSLDKPYIEMSTEVFEALTLLKKFNYEKIYYLTNLEIDKYAQMFNALFDKLLYNLENNINCDINDVFLIDATEKYKNDTTDARKVIDYIAGMTDDFFLAQYNKYCINK